jgi:hypothetical protein
MHDDPLGACLHHGTNRGTIGTGIGRHYVNPRELVNYADVELGSPGVPPEGASVKGHLILFDTT